MGTPADYRALVDQLYALKPRGGRLGIDRMRPLAAALRNPERTMPVVHVAGTNGKGSVAAMIEAMLRAAWEESSSRSRRLIVERFALGRDHRVLVVNGKVVACAERIAAHVTGNGTATIRELIEEANRDPRRGRGHTKVLTYLPLDAQTE